MPSGELEGLPASVVGFLSCLPVPRHNAHKIHPPESLYAAGPLLFGLAERAKIPLRCGYRRCSVMRMERGDVLTDMAARMALGCPSR
jgi:hypothetical protein